MSQQKVNAMILALIFTAVIIVAWFYFYDRAEKNVDNLLQNSSKSTLEN